AVPPELRALSRTGLAEIDRISNREVAVAAAHEVGPISVGTPPVVGIVLEEVVVGKMKEQHEVVIEARRQVFVEEEFLQRAEAARGSEVEVLDARLRLEDIGHPPAEGRSHAFDERIA